MVILVQVVGHDVQYKARFTDEHPQSSHGFGIVVAEDGEVLGPSEYDRGGIVPQPYIHLNQDEEDLSENEREWMTKQAVEHLSRDPTEPHYSFGATWKKQCYDLRKRADRAAQKRRGEKVVWNR